MAAHALVACSPGFGRTGCDDQRGRLTAKRFAGRPQEFNHTRPALKILDHHRRRKALARLARDPAHLSQTDVTVMVESAKMLATDAAVHLRAGTERLTGAQLIEFMQDKTVALIYARIAVNAGTWATLLREMATIIERSGTRVLVAVQARDDAALVLAEAMHENQAPSLAPDTQATPSPIAGD